MSTFEEEAVRGSSKCQDCGNQAKKGCVYLRCRTCCKNKGFLCETHVKSTWVPADHRRRHRENHHHPPPPSLNHPHHLHEDLSKRHKHNPYPLADKKKLKFPASVSMTATFRCVQVQSMEEDWVDEYAYHTSVSIGGHVFSGLVYDQGPTEGGGGESSSGPLLLQHHNAVTQTQDGAAMAPPLPSSADSLLHYSYPLTATFLPGMPYFSNPKPY